MEAKIEYFLQMLMPGSISPKHLKGLPVFVMLNGVKHLYNIEILRFTQNDKDEFEAPLELVPKLIRRFWTETNRFQ